MSIFNDDALPEEINRSHCLLIAVMFTPPKSHLPRLLLVSRTTRLESQSAVQFVMRLKAEETLGKLHLWWLPSNDCRVHQCILKEKYVRRNIVSGPKDDSKSRLYFLIKGKSTFKLWTTSMSSDIEQLPTSGVKTPKTHLLMYVCPACLSLFVQFHAQDKMASIFI